MRRTWFSINVEDAELVLLCCSFPISFLFYFSVVFFLGESWFFL